MAKQQAIIHAQMRYLYRLTTDPDYRLDSDESKIDVPNNFVIPPGGPWILGADNITLTAASAQQLDRAEFTLRPPDIEALLLSTQNLIRAIDSDLIPSVSWRDELRNFCVAQAVVLSRRGRRV